MALSTTQMYTCGGNAFWCDPLSLSQPLVPISRRGVKYLEKYTWHQADPPSHFPGSISVAIDNNKGNFAKGALKSVSALAGRILENATVDNTAVQQKT
jgi:hypothetical protein